MARIFALLILVAAATGAVAGERFPILQPDQMNVDQRKLLEALLTSHNPLGAYEIMDRLGRRTRPAPITIYRALDFLSDNHRIETRNAFVACVRNHTDDDLVIFLICERCGTVGETLGDNAAEALKASSHAAGFSPKSPVIEIAGICSHCRER